MLSATTTEEERYICPKRIRYDADSWRFIPMIYGIIIGSRSSFSSLEVPEWQPDACCTFRILHIPQSYFFCLPSPATISRLQAESVYLSLMYTSNAQQVYSEWSFVNAMRSMTWWESHRQRICSLLNAVNSIDIFSSVYNKNVSEIIQWKLIICIHWITCFSSLIHRRIIFNT